MKSVKKISKKIAVILLALMMTTPLMVMAKEVRSTEQAVKQEVHLKNDFYEAINKDWLQATTLKPGYSAMDTFTEVNDKCTEQLQKLFAEILGNEEKYSASSTEKMMINLYQNYLNMEERNKQGITPIKSYLQHIKELKSIDEVNKLFTDIIQVNMTSIYSLGISTDLKDSNIKQLYLHSTGLLIGDADYYNKPTEKTKVMEQAITTYLEKILALSGYSKEEAEKKVTDAYKFEKLLTPYIIGQEEASKESNIYEKMYNVYSLDELEKLAPRLKLKDTIQTITMGKVSKVIVTEPKWLEALNKVYTEENLELMKNYMEIKFLSSNAGGLSQDFIDANNELSATIMGVKGELPLEQQAMQVISSVFSDEIGKLYVEKYFSQAAKEDVEALAKDIIANYKKKLEKVDWLTDETKENAIRKLDSMKIKVGYPDKWQDYSGLVIRSYQEGGSLTENTFNLSRWTNKKAIDEMTDKVDRSKFIMAPQTVNACYVATRNDITFPAAILQSPFYDINRSREENLGSIGVIMAHEVSHAFDTAGANFDENGNVKQWWTEEDYAKFEEKAQKFRDYYMTVVTDSGEKVNGDLTVGENIADITAMSCALEILKEMDDPDYKAFFESWAKTWKMVATDEYKTLLLQKDVHSPHKIRVNVVLQQFQEFYDIYGIKENDGMYVKPEERLRIY